LSQQQGKIWRIGFLWQLEQSDYVKQIDAFKAGMRALGYAEGRDYVIEQRSAQNDLARLPALAAELLALKVDVIVPQGTPAAEAARKVTRDITILIVTVVDPVGTGLAATLSRPGGNVTGLTQDVGTDLYTKRLDLLRQILPGMRRVGILYNPDNSSDAPVLRQFESDCAKLGFKSIRAPVRKREEIAAVFNTLKRDQARGLIVTSAGTNTAWRDGIIEHAAKHRLPAVYSNSGYADSGGLISYGANSEDLYRRVAAYAVKIFKGAKPGDLPIEQPSKFETVINLKTTKALGIKIPDVILLRADRVIE
jgi:putative ABC transport system substrate-binding protein